MQKVLAIQKNEKAKSPSQVVGHNKKKIQKQSLKSRMHLLQCSCFSFPFPIMIF